VTIVWALPLARENTIGRLYSAVNARRLAFSVTSPRDVIAVAVMVGSLLALLSKLQGSSCLTHVGREGRRGQEDQRDKAASPCRYAGATHRRRRSSHRRPGSRRGKAAPRSVRRDVEAATAHLGPTVVTPGN
jgi:hypothetical protein